MNTKKEIVLNFIEALNKNDFHQAKEYLNENFVFKSRSRKRAGVDTFIEEMQSTPHTYIVRDIYSNSKYVCVIYDIQSPHQENITTCGLYRVRKKKIDSLTVVFDTRPITVTQRKIIMD